MLNKKKYTGNLFFGCTRPFETPTKIKDDIQQDFERIRFNNTLKIL